MLFAGHNVPSSGKTDDDQIGSPPAGNPSGGTPYIVLCTPVSGQGAKCKLYTQPKEDVLKVDS